MVRYAFYTLMDLLRIDMSRGGKLLPEYEPMLRQALPTFGGSLEAFKAMTAQQLGEMLPDSANQ